MKTDKRMPARPIRLSVPIRCRGFVESTAAGEAYPFIRSDPLLRIMGGRAWGNRQNL